MKKLILLLTLPLLAVTFNSCSKDDDGDVNGITKLVKRIVNGNYKDVSAFEYDTQNRLIKHIWDEEGQVVDGKPWGGTANYITMSIVYEANKMICTNSDLLYPEYKDIQTIYLDNAGYVTSIQTVEFGNDVETNRYNKTYTYKDGYLSTIVDESPSYYNYSGSFVWQNGNIIKATFLDGYEYVYEYTDIPNKLNINPDFFPHVWWDLPKMKGTYSKNLPASCKVYIGGVLRDDLSGTYAYTLDNDGYPITIVETNSSGNSHTTTLSYY